MNKSNIYTLAFFLFITLFLAQCKVAKTPETMPKQMEGLDVLQADKNQALIQTHCTACHSAKLITMNRFSREGWKEKIEWMQESQNLWDLGDAEPLILDYLSTFYAPEKQASRRASLKNISWFEMED